MVCREISRGLWYIGVNRPDLRTFGEISYTENGTMRGSYLMDTGEGCMVIGSPGEGDVQEWIDTISGIIGTGEVKWGLLHGLAQDVGAGAALLQKWPELTLIGGMDLLCRVEDYAECGFHRIAVRGRRRLSFGNRTFLLATLTDQAKTASLYALEEKSKTLFTADAFGAVCAFAGRGSTGMTDGAGQPVPAKEGAEENDCLVSGMQNREVYFDGVRRYLNEIRFRERQASLKEAAALVREHGVQMICPAMGPVADCEIERLLEETLVAGMPPESARRPQVAVVYFPGEGVREIARCIGKGIEEAGDIQARLFDLSVTGREAVLEEIRDCDAYLFGTPDVEGDAAKAVWDIVTSLSEKNLRGKKTAVFTPARLKDSFGRIWKERVRALGGDITMTDYVIPARPDRKSWDNAKEYGYGIGCCVLKQPNLRKPTMVKCLVCGEIFDAALGTCPVCGVGLELCVPLNDEDEVLQSRNTDNRYLIIGGGIAAVKAAQAIRLRDETGEIHLFSAENILPINRPMLTKNLDIMKEAPESLLIHGQEWYEEQRIRLHLGTRIMSLNVKDRYITSETGEQYDYDRLIYAAGAECFVPPFEGADKKGVLTIRHLEDQECLNEMVRPGGRAVVIGGGVLGLEAASELMRSGMGVTVLEATPQIIGRQVDGETAAILKEKMRAMKVACYEGVSIAGMEGADRVTGVRLADGRVFAADVVVVSCGNWGNIGPAVEAGIAAGRSIIVNERMETNIRDVYACGDCAQFEDINYQLWQEASDQGNVAGANAAGDTMVYKSRPLGLSLEGFGTELFAIGDVGKREDIPYRRVNVSDGVTLREEKYWFYGGRLQGAVLIGAPQKTADVSMAVVTHADYTELF